MASSPSRQTGGAAPKTGDAAPKFVVLDTLKDASGITAQITQRTANGVITFSIFRVFERDGVEDWTSYFSEAQLSDFEEMLGNVKRRMAELRADPKVAPMRTGTNHR